MYPEQEGAIQHLPAAQRPPFATIGDTLSSSTCWHGEHLIRWANDWVRLYRGHGANFMTSNMEDRGTLTTLNRLGRQCLVDPDRELMLGTVRNFTMPPKGQSAEWSKSQPYPDRGKLAIEAAFVVGNTVVQALLDNWADYHEKLPRAGEQ